MRTMIPVYKAELDAGLADAVGGRSSVAYEVALTEVTDEAVRDAMRASTAAHPPVVAPYGYCPTCGKVAVATERRPDGATTCPDGHSHPRSAMLAAPPAPFEHAQASLGDELDLFYMQDILATAGWNTNKDVFLRDEVWAARHTPDDKPLSFQHDRADVIGHIVRTVPVGLDYRPLAAVASVDELPETFHLLNGTVVYRLPLPKNEREVARAAFLDRTIDEIKAGQWAVSMECHFTNFDYGVIAPDGRQFIIPRTAATAHLTPYLRAVYPDDPADLLRVRTRRNDQRLGSNTFLDQASGQEFQLGRVFRNLAFSGKGLVKRPGNPDSVIFSSVAAFVPSHDETVYFSARPEPEAPAGAAQELEPMPETNEVQGLQATVASLREEIESLRAKTAANTTASLEASHATLKSEADGLRTQLAASAAQLETFKATVADLTGRAATAETALTSALAELAAVAVEKATAARKSLVTNKGLDQAKVDAFVQNLKVLDDAAFAAHVEILAPTWKTAPAKTETQVIDEAKPEPEPAMAVASAVDDGASRREAVGNYLGSLLRTPNGRRTQ